jgi:hypothetical protein
MYYWVLRSPPGYPPDRAYLACEYATQDPESYVQDLGFAPSLEAARALLRLPCQPLDGRSVDQFIELWKAGATDV